MNIGYEHVPDETIVSTFELHLDTEMRTAIHAYFFHDAKAREIPSLIGHFWKQSNV